MPTTTSTRLTNSAKLSAVTTPKLVALRSHSSTEATPAPTRPMMARPPIGIRSPFSRNASASRANSPASATQITGTTASKALLNIYLALAGAGRGHGRRQGRSGTTPPAGIDPHRLARFHPLDDARHGRLHRRQEQVGRDAHHDRHRAQRADDRPLAHAEVLQVAVLGVGDRAVVDALEHPQHVDRRQDHAEAGDDDEARIPAEGAEQDQELADEPVQCRAGRPTPA